MTGPQVRVLSAGAARGLVEQVRAEVEASTDAVVVATFGPVGAIGDAISSGDDVDVVITSAPRMAQLRDRVLAGSLAPLGAVPTCLAVRAADAAPESGSLARMLLGADALYCPDPARATAGIHLVSVLEHLGIANAVRPRLRVSPHGAAAMRALAEAGEEAPLGCTQLTEILATGGVRPVGPLPSPYALSTVYCAAVLRDSSVPDLAGRLVSVLTDAGNVDLRRRAGFDETPH